MKIIPLHDRVLVKRMGEEEVKEGDTFLIGKYAGTEIKIEGEEHLIVRENDILGIIRE